MPDIEMINRVSKAILETPNSSDYEELVAKRAIAAMREPTERILQVNCFSLNYSTAQIWNKFIDFILK